jgi:hypothetical protein
MMKSIIAMLGIDTKGSSQRNLQIVRYNMGTLEMDSHLNPANLLDSQNYSIDSP